MTVIRMRFILSVLSRCRGASVPARAEHALGVCRCRGGRLFGAYALDLGDLFAYVTHVCRLVALAAMGYGGQVGAVGLQHNVFERYLGHGGCDGALLERDDTPDAEEPLAAAAQAPVCGGILRKGVQYAPQPLSARCGRGALRFEYVAHVLPRGTRVYGYGHVEPCRQTALRHESLALLGYGAAAPVIVEADLSHGAEAHAVRRVRQTVLYRGEFLAPAGVVVDGCGVQSHHGSAHVGRGRGQREEPLVREGVDGGQQEPYDAGVAGALQRFGAVVVELFGVEVRVGVRQSHR